MSKNTNIADLINYISVDGSGNVVLTTGGQVATQSYVTTAVSNLVNAAPSTLDTLNELAAALGNDANFATTVTNSIATKQAQLNGTGFVKISGTTVSYDNSTYLTTSSASSNYLPLAGGTLTGALSGTSATFSGNFGVGTASPSVYTNLNTITINGTSGSVIDFKTGEVLYGELYSLANEFRVDAVGASGVLKLLTNSVPRLTIASTGAATFSSSVTATNGIFSGEVYNTTTGAFFIANAIGNTSYPTYGFYNNVGVGMYRPSADVLGFVTSSTERMRINNSGNVGIGTSSPSERLHVNGNVYIGGTGNALYFDTDASAKTISQYVDNLYEFHILNGRGNSARFILGNGSISLGTSSTPQFYINTGTGNIGVGASSPISKLHVNGGKLIHTSDDGGYGQFQINASSASTEATILLSNGGSGVNTGNYTNVGVVGMGAYGNTRSTLVLGTGYNGGTLFIRDSKLGIRVSSPDAPLHVGGAILVSNNAQTFRRAITNHGATGTFTEVKVIFNKTNWGSVTYDIKLASAGGSYHTAGAYYSNPGFSSHVNSVNAGVGCAMALTAESPNGGSQGATWRFYGATMIHPMVTVDIASGNGYQVNPDDIIVQFN